MGVSPVFAARRAGRPFHSTRGTQAASSLVHLNRRKPGKALPLEMHRVGMSF